MNRPLVIVIVAVAVILAAAAAYIYSRRRRSQLLRERFGPEYDRLVGQEKSVQRAEGVLQFREKAREKLEIRPLSRAQQADFANRWNEAQAQFVDEPGQAVSIADHLVSEVMQARGYPVDNFAHRAEIVSVDHPVVVQNYRVAHEIAIRQGAGQTNTEDLRQAMVHYRLLFNELLKDSLIERKEARG